MSKKAVELIKEFEGCRLLAYRCPKGIWTIGYGHTGPVAGPGVKISQEEAERLLSIDVAMAELSLRKICKVPLLETEIAALISLIFNIGPSAFSTSTLLKCIVSGDFVKAADEFLRWDKVTKIINGVKHVETLPGLTRRRQRERLLFIEDAYNS